MSFTDGFMAAFLGADDADADAQATPARRLRHQSLSLPPEIEEGHVEYKRKLSHPSPERYRKLVTQLHWRLGEGSRMALYEVGVEDNGELAGLDADDLAASLETLHRMAHELDAEAAVLRQVELANGRKVVEVLIRKTPSAHRFTEVRIAVVGGANAGKSTLLGVLTRGEVDNGRGKARRSLLNHRHEIESGQTSSVSYEVIGFDSHGRLLNSASDTATWASICEQSARVVTFVDLAGREKYLHTTVCGLTGGNPDLACLVVGARAGVTRMTEEHFHLAVALDVPIFAVVTAIDGCAESHLQTTLRDVERLLQRDSAAPRVVRTPADVDALDGPADPHVRPVFLVSSVTGVNLDLLLRYLQTVEAPGRRPAVALAAAPAGSDEVEVRIEDVYTVPDFGTVVAGLVVRGTVAEGTALRLGPDAAGDFATTAVASIRRSCVAVSAAEAGQHATFALREVPAAAVRRGMVLVTRPERARITRRVDATVETVSASVAALRVNSVGMLHMGSVRQAAIVGEITAGAGVAHAVFHLARVPEYVGVGDRFLFRCSAGFVKGQVTAVAPLDVDDGRRPAAQYARKFSPPRNNVFRGPPLAPVPL